MHTYLVIHTLSVCINNSLCARCTLSGSVHMREPDSHMCAHGSEKREKEREMHFALIIINRGINTQPNTNRYMCAAYREIEREFSNISKLLKRRV